MPSPPNVSALLAAAATRVCVGPSGDVEMTPVGETQQNEDTNLRKVVAQLHVNFGHPSNDALARAIRLSGRLTEPSRVPAASLRRWTEFGQCVALDLIRFADIAGQNGLFFIMLDMSSHHQVGRQESLDGVQWISAQLVSHTWCS